MSEPVLTVNDVGKRFGSYQALNHITFHVGRGEVYALVGQNGAGKTTLMRLIAGLSPLDLGDITLLGERAGHYRAALSRIGAVIETPAAFSKLTVEQNLRVTATQHGVVSKKDIDTAIDFVGLEEKRKAKAASLSLGQKQRLGLATAILPHPDFLILDEPINGLDPMGIVEMRGLIKRLSQEMGTTILISSHILSELHQVAATFGFLHRGSLIQQLTKAELDQANQTGLLIQVAGQADAAAAGRVLDQAHITDFSVLNDHEIVVRDLRAQPAALNQLLVGAGVGVTGITRKESSLEDYFTALIGNQENQETAR
jgi:ABC-2 type transport system ATP-binding protein